MGYDDDDIDYPETLDTHFILQQFDILQEVLDSISADIDRLEKKVDAIHKSVVKEI